MTISAKEISDMWRQQIGELPMICAFCGKQIVGTFMRMVECEDGSYSPDDYYHYPECWNADKEARKAKKVTP